MNKEYEKICHKYNLNKDNYQIIDGITVIPTQKEDVIVLLTSENLYPHVLDIYKKDKNISEKEFKEIIKGMNDKYLNAKSVLPFPFEDYSLGQIVAISDAISIEETNHGHSSSLYFGDMCLDEEKDKNLINFFAYAKFVGSQIDNYFMNSYKMKILGFDYPNVYEYVSSLMNNINDCIDNFIKEGKRPFPIHILEYIGQSENINIYNHALFDIIELLLASKNYKIGSGDDYCNIIPIDDTPSLDELNAKYLKQLMK